MTGPAVLVGAAWIVAVVAVGRPRRRPGRVADLGSVPSAALDGAPTRGGRPRPRVLIRAAATIRRWAHRPDDPVADRRLGRSLVVLVLVPVGLPLPVAVAVGVALWCHPVVAARRDRRRRRRALVDELPDAVDLLRLAVRSGGNARMAVTAVAARLDGEVGGQLREVCRRVELGDRLADALAALRSLEPLRPVADALIDAERYGVALDPSLERLAAEARSLRRRDAEERARRVPVAMLFPLVGCVLPSFALLTVVPLFAGTLRSLRF